MTIRNKPIIADTSGLVSLLLQTDVNHETALQAAKAIIKAHKNIIIPTAVQYEFLNVMGKRIDHRDALEAAVELEEPPFIVHDEPWSREKAKEKFSKLPQAVSYTDCVVMAIADHYDTVDIFGFDKQFETAGYRRLTPSTEHRKAA